MDTLTTFIVFPLLAVLTLGVMYYFSKRQERAKRAPKGKEEKRKQKDSESDRGEIEKAIGIMQMKNNIITDYDGSLSCIIEYSTPDYWSMKEEEQNHYENKLMQFGVSCKKLFKIIEMPGKSKTVKACDPIAEYINSDELTEKAKGYAEKLIEEFSKQEYDRKEIEKKKYIIIGTNLTNREKALGELKTNVSLFVSNLSKAGISYKLLDTTEIIEFVNEYINRSRFDVEKAENEGIFELFSRI